jgi:hypothetical protein
MRRVGRFTGTIWQRGLEGLCSLVVMYASPFRDCAFAERNRIGGARKKKRSQKTWGTLRREVHAAQEVLEARVGAQGRRSEHSSHGPSEAKGVDYHSSKNSPASRRCYRR